MRFKYLPIVKKIQPSTMNFICGFEQNQFINADGFIDTPVLFSLLQNDAYEVSDKLEEIFTDFNWKATGEVNKYHLIGGEIEELIIVNKNRSLVSAVYTTMVGGGDDPGMLVAASLQELSKQMQDISDDRADSINKLNSILVKV
jgi:hypothetical protein